MFTPLLLALVVLVAMAFRTHLESQAYSNWGRIAWAKEHVGPSTRTTERISRAYEKALAADPDNYLPGLGYGQWLLEQGELERAASLLELAVALRPTDRRSHFYLGVTYLRLGRSGEAVSHFRQSNTPPMTLIDRGWRHVEQIRSQPPEQRDWTIAERYYRAAAALRPDDLTLWKYLAEFYMLWPRDYDQALATWQLAAQALPASPTPHRNAAELLWSRQQDAAGALAELREAVRLTPDDVGTYLYAADILRKTGDLAAAETWLQRATQAVPASGEPYFRLGELYLAQGHTPQAVQAFQAATEVAPAEVRYQVRLAEALQSMGLTDEAVLAYRRVLELDPDQAEARRALEELTAGDAR